MYRRLIPIFGFLISFTFTVMISSSITFAIDPCTGLSGTECILNCSSGDADLVCSSTDKKCTASCGIDSGNSKNDAIVLFKNVARDVFICIGDSVKPSNFIDSLVQRYKEKGRFVIVSEDAKFSWIREKYEFVNNKKVEVLIGFQKSTLEFLNKPDNVIDTLQQAKSELQ